MLGAAIALGACQTDPPPTAEEEAMRARQRTVAYENGILRVGETDLRQLPNHKISKTFKVPVQWPAASSVVIQTAGQESGAPAVAAVVFERGAAGEAGSLNEHAHHMLYDTRVPTVAEAALEGGGRQCRYDVRDGPMNEPDDGARRSSGVIIVSEDDQATFGLFIRGEDLDEIKRLTIEMAEQLCAGGREA
jgi:hypothetical protein